MWSQAFLILFLTTFTIASKDIGKVIDSLLANYDKRIRPGSGEKPVDVSIEVSLRDIYNFNELSHEVTLSMFLKQKWIDKRLSFNPADVNGTTMFMLDSEQSKKVWIPDTFIRNERSSFKHDFSTPNEYTKIYHNGSITRSMNGYLQSYKRISDLVSTCTNYTSAGCPTERKFIWKYMLTVTVGCILNLRFFPFDQNICSLDFESYGYSMNDVRYLWVKDYRTGDPKIRVSKETAQSVRHEIKAVRGKDHQIESTGEEYSRVGLAIFFKRLSFRYLLDVYFPATAIPVVAFITLCVGPLHFRVLLSTICMAMMVLYSVILMTLTPKVDYKTALDFYVFNSSVTVFNVVLVNFFIYYLLKPKPAPTQIRMRQINGSSDEGKGILADEENVEDPSGAGPSNAQPRFPSKTTELLYKLCEKSYLTMPIFFVVFNIIYWPVVLIASGWTPDDFIPLEDLPA